MLHTMPLTLLSVSFVFSIDVNIQYVCTSQYNTMYVYVTSVRLFFRGALDMHGVVVCS